MPRAWVFSQLTGTGLPSADVPGGVHASTSLAKTPELKPFLMYRSVAHRPGDRGDDADINRNETYLVFVHDVPGSYVKIDAILAKLKLVFNNTKDGAAGVGRSLWVEDSEDFRDEDMGTIMRYARITVRYLP